MEIFLLFLFVQPRYMHGLIFSCFTALFITAMHNAANTSTLMTLYCLITPNQLGGTHLIRFTMFERIYFLFLYVLFSLVCFSCLKLAEQINTNSQDGVLHHSVNLPQSPLTLYVLVQQQTVSDQMSAKGFPEDNTQERALNILLI